MNLPANYLDCGLPHSQPCLYFEEHCLRHFPWSHDSKRGPSAENGWLGYYGTAGGVLSGLGFPNNIYHREGLGYKCDFLTWDWLPDFQPENPETCAVGEQWNTEAEVQDISFQPTSPININGIIKGTSQDIDQPSKAVATPIPQHYRIESHSENVCYECSLQFPHTSALDTHAKQTLHGPYACSCGSTFVRFDILARHLRTFNPKVFYPCLFCSKFSGQSAFKRLDHLTQHLRGYHNHETSAEPPDLQAALEFSSKSKKSALYCFHKDCVYHHDTVHKQALSAHSQNVKGGFSTRRDFTKHLRNVHNESLYPCDVLGCDRIGGRGFFRERDLIKHQKVHFANNSDFALL